MKTNLNLLTHLMNYSSHGAIMQGFIMAALDNYAQQILQHDDQHPPTDWPATLSWPTWHGCAEEMKNELDKHFKRITKHVELTEET